jgi:hypothetical protein
MAKIIGTLAAWRVAEGFQGLGPHMVVSGHDDNSDIRYLGRPLPA